MAYEVSDRELAAVSALSNRERYAHFLKRVADTQSVWSLRASDGGWLLAGRTAGGDPVLVPVWPHARYAEACATDAWAGSVPAAIVLDAWLDDWLPGIAAAGRAVLVFPTPAAGGAEVDVEQLRADLEEALLAPE